MTMERFPFQTECVAKTTGVVLNVGCNADPGGLRARFGERVVNCDIRTANPDTGEEYPVQSIFDCTKTWPFAQDVAELVVLGDIVEHLFPAELEVCLTEARRVAQKLCITVPEDDRIHTEADYWQRYEGSPKGEYHCNVVTEPFLRRELDNSGWEVEDWRTVDYGFVPRGFFILARRRSSLPTSGDTERILNADNVEGGGDA